MELAVENECHSIGFPLISSGIYKYPKDRAWREAIQACEDFFAQNPDIELHVVFAVINDGVLALGESILDEIAGEQKA